MIDADFLGIDFAILGLPVFSAFHITADLENNQLTFQPGCGCSTRTSQYPMMFKDYEGSCAGNCKRSNASCDCQDTFFAAKDLTKRSNASRKTLNYLLAILCVVLII